MKNHPERARRRGGSAMILAKQAAKYTQKALECGDASPHWHLAPHGESKQSGAGAPPSKIRRCSAAFDGGTPKQSGK